MYRIISYAAVALLTAGNGAAPPQRTDVSAGICEYNSPITG